MEGRRGEEEGMGKRKKRRREEKTERSERRGGVIEAESEAYILHPVTYHTVRINGSMEGCGVSVGIAGQH